MNMVIHQLPLVGYIPAHADYAAVWELGEKNDLENPRQM